VIHFKDGLVERIERSAAAGDDRLTRASSGGGQGPTDDAALPRRDVGETA
jgi:hypothetical protein